ncbi:quinoprotein relay system zinc metallohydrolase 2 [Bradyrhizobium erythrophlei]|uniref:quinoprotein relay system zinc metallohydrolase 2 n=1 Tax=Bradyrhizobium erythrophlei TaxID=1437360 RepID=UPI0035EA1259
MGFALDKALSRRAALLGGLCLCCVPSRLRATASLAPLPAPMIEVAPGLHVRRGVTEDAAAGNFDGIANLGFIIGRDAVAVIDPGGSLHDGRSLLLAIRARTQLPIRYVVLSHVHPDHIFGAAAFRQDGAIFIGHAELPQQLAARGDFYRAGLERLLGAAEAGDVVSPTMLVRHGQPLELDLGGRSLVLTAHPPAHTVCDLSVLDKPSGILLASDLLFVDRVPALDGDLNGWLAALAAMRASGIRHAVPGHGPPLVEVQDAIAPLERYLALLRDETRAAIKKGLPIEDAAISVAQSERTRWPLFDAYNGRNVIEAYRRLEWE